jgi:Holliday junction resolvase
MPFRLRASAKRRGPGGDHVTARGWFAYRYLDDVANLYRERGFEVLVAPRSTQLPFNHGNFLPDILAWSNGHYIAVEVKFSVD